MFKLNAKNLGADLNPGGPSSPCCPRAHRRSGRCKIQMKPDGRFLEKIWLPSSKDRKTSLAIRTSLSMESATTYTVPLRMLGEK